MTPPPIPLHERDRLAVLRELGILDTPPDPAFDSLTRLASEVLGMPIALVSLVDADRQWFKSAVGLAQRQTPRGQAFCAHAIAGEGLFEVTDAGADPRFHDNPLVTGEPGIRFYAGVPLHVDGQPVGTFCVNDRRPRRLDGRERLLLGRFAAMAELQLAQHQRLVAASLTDRRLGDFVAASGDWLWETEGLRVRWVSDNVEQVLGVPPADYARHLMIESLAEDGIQMRTENARALSAIRAQQPFRDMTVIRRTPRGERIVHKSGVPVHDASGRFIGYRGVARDVTVAALERRSALSAEARLREAIELLDEACVMTDAQDRIVLTNARWRAYNVRPGEPVSTDWETHARRLLAEGRVDAARGREEAWLAERIASRRMGSGRFEFRVHGADFVGHDQRLSDGSCLTVSVDITEIKAGHRAVAEAAQRLELAVRATGLSVWEADAESGALELVLRPPELLDARIPADLDDFVAGIVPADRGRVAQAFDALRGGRLDSIREEYTANRDGRPLRALVEATLLPAEPGRKRRIVGVRRDVTDARRAEGAAREKAAAELANTAKTEFLARIGHELRTPLNAISGLAQVLRREPAGESPQARQSLVGHIITASDHLSALLEDLLDMAQVESGRVAIRVEPVPVAALLHDCLRMMAPQAAGHGIALEMGVVAGGLLAQADPTRMRQIVLNLVSNAIKHNRLQGRVRIEATDAQADGFVSVAVSDTGPGLSREEVGRIFQPFERIVRGDGLTTEGLGLGLSIAQGLAVAMAGSIRVDSEPGRGTVFTLDLPAARPTADAGDDAEGFAPAEADVADMADAFAGTGSRDPDTRLADALGRIAATLRSEGSARDEETRAVALPEPVADRGAAARLDPACAPAPRKVLYVEDNRLNAVLMQQIARQVPGLELRVVESGEEALAVIRAFAPDLLLLDNDLPGASGVEVHEMLRDDPCHVAMRTVLVSADATAASIERARTLGFDDYWVKPLDVEHVIGALGGSSVTA
jgi:signal transduction histidine kinase